MFLLGNIYHILSIFQLRFDLYESFDLNNFMTQEIKFYKPIEQSPQNIYTSDMYMDVHTHAHMAYLFRSGSIQISGQGKLRSFRPISITFIFH